MLQFIVFVQRLNWLVSVFARDTNKKTTGPHYPILICYARVHSLPGFFIGAMI